MMEIQTLGNFSIKVNGIEITSNFKKSKKLLQLLSLLIINRHKSIPATVISDVIWPDSDVDTDKALQNLVFRMRKLFAGSSNDKNIIYNSGTYMMCISSDIQLDAQLFEDYYKRAKKLGKEQQLYQEEEKVLLKDAVDLYKGEYVFSSICGDSYSYYTANRYKFMFSDAVCMLSDLYLGSGEYEEVIDLCDKAISLEPLDEQIYIRMVRGLCGMGRNIQAITLIEDYFELLDREMGACESEELDSIYKQLKGLTKTTNVNAEQIVDELQGMNFDNKALYCSYSTLKDLYRYETRQLDRSDNMILTVLAEIECDAAVRNQETVIAASAKHLHEACMHILRRGDMFADYSSSQKVLVIVLARKDNIYPILNRISANFYSRTEGKSVSLKFNTHILSAARPDAYVHTAASLPDKVYKASDLAYVG